MNDKEIRKHNKKELIIFIIEIVIMTIAYCIILNELYIYEEAVLIVINKSSFILKIIYSIIFNLGCELFYILTSLLIFLSNNFKKTSLEIKKDKKIRNIKLKYRILRVERRLKDLNLKGGKHE